MGRKVHRFVLKCFGFLFGVIGIILIAAFVIEWVDGSKPVQHDDYKVRTQSRLNNSPSQEYSLSQRWKDLGWKLDSKNEIHFLRNSFNEKKYEFMLRKIDPKNSLYDGECVARAKKSDDKYCLALWLIGCDRYVLKQDIADKEIKLVTRQVVGRDTKDIDFALVVPTEKMSDCFYIKLKEVIVEENDSEPKRAVTEPRILYDIKRNGYLIKTDEKIKIPKPEIKPPHPNTYHHKYYS